MNEENPPIQEPEQAAETPPPPTPRPAFTTIISSALVGVLVGIIVVLVYQTYSSAISQTLYTALLIGFGVLVVTFVLLFGLKHYLTRFFFGSKAAEAGDILEDAQRVSDVLTDRMADRLLSDAPAEVRQRVRHILPRLVNWFVWARLRNWWWQWLLGIFVSLGGLTGTLLLMNQNELLEAQNIKIDSQTNLMQKQTELAQQQTELLVRKP
jgi:hypothetical protein